MSIQISSVHALPQAKRLMHVEKSGPAFEQVDTYYSAHAVDQYGVARCWGRGDTADTAEAQCLDEMRDYKRPDLRLTLRSAQPCGRPVPSAQDANETEFLPVSVADQLGASLVAQTTQAIGDVLSAINRGCLLDVIPAWQRLLKVQMLKLPIPTMDTVTIRHRWAYAELRDAVDAALSSQVGPWAWVRPDMMIRQMAREQAERSDVTLMGLTRDWFSVELRDEALTRETLRQSMVTVTNNIATLRAFAEGK